MSDKIYITIPVKSKTYQLSFEMLMTMSDEDVDKLLNMSSRETYDTATYLRNPEEMKDKFDSFDAYAVLKAFNTKYADLYTRAVNKDETLFKHFNLPKKNGGFRPIDAPNEELMECLRELKGIFETTFQAKYHTSAFAYVPKRTTYAAIQRHQSNESRWFLKLDISNFFGSTTKEFVMNQLSKIYPFNFVIENEACRGELEKALTLCFLNNTLPQGTPISPMLTNLIMIPVDYQINKYLHKNFSNSRFVYTRYADDVLISSPYNFKWTDIQSEYVNILNMFQAPFKLNTKKTRYGSRAGQNWNLGLMLNKDNDITVGADNKKTFKAYLCNFIQDHKNGKDWSVSNVRVLQGKLAYNKSVEPEYFTQLIGHYNQKFGVNVEEMMSNILKGLPPIKVVA